jgi:hypothetical protein
MATEHAQFGISDVTVLLTMANALLSLAALGSLLIIYDYTWMLSMRRKLVHYLPSHIRPCTNK